MRLGVDGLDMHRQRVVAEVSGLRLVGLTNEVHVVPGHAGLEHPAFAQI